MFHPKTQRISRRMRFCVCSRRLPGKLGVITIREPIYIGSAKIVAQVADPFPDPETVVYSRQCLARTAAALTTLPDRTRKAFELHRLSGRTIAQVAEELGLSTTRTWALIRDAYRHLLNHVGDI